MDATVATDGPLLTYTAPAVQHTPLEGARSEKLPDGLLRSVYLPGGCGSVQPGQGQHFTCECNCSESYKCCNRHRLTEASAAYALESLHGNQGQTFWLASFAQGRLEGEVLNESQARGGFPALGRNASP